MSDTNTIFISGNVVAEPEFKAGSNDRDDFLKVRIASNRSYKDGDSWKEEACFVDVETYGHVATRYAPHLRKGMKITVEGGLRYHSWTQEGKKRVRMFIYAHSIYLLEKLPAQAESTYRQPASQAPAAAPRTASPSIGEALARSVHMGAEPPPDAPFE